MLERKIDGGVLIREKVNLWVESVFLLTLLAGCCGCLKTELNPPPQDGIARLLDVTPRTLSFTIVAPAEEATVGHQYVLILIPFGRIVVKSPYNLVRQELLAQGALAGFRPVPATGQAALRISLDEISVSGHDYLFFRRSTAVVRIQATLFDGSGHQRRQAIAMGQAGEFAKFAFEPELSRVLNDAAKTALADAIKQLGLI